MISPTTTSPMRRISFLQLGRALNLQPRELKGVVSARDFPDFAGHEAGQRTWYAVAVANWLEKHNFPADAAAVKNFGKEPNE
jgi:hypothetical protein